MGRYRYSIEQNKISRLINDEEKNGKIESLKEVLKFLTSIGDNVRLVDLISGGGGIELDPTVPAWAKVDNPSATIAEIERILYLD